MKMDIRIGEAELHAEGKDVYVESVTQKFYEFLNTMAKHNCQIANLDSGKLENIEGQHAEMHEGGCVLHVGNKTKASWKDIAEEIENGSLVLEIGDYVTTHLTDGTEADFVVTDKPDGYYRFESRDCVGDKVFWNEKGDTEGGYPKSDIRKYVDDKLWELLPEELQDIICPIIRKYEDTDGEIKEFETRLFLPAASEVFSKDDCYGDKGIYEQIDYYKDYRNRIRGAAKGGDATWYYLASVYGGGSALACGVSGYGCASTGSASTAFRLPLCFQIKKRKIE